MALGVRVTKALLCKTCIFLLNIFCLLVLDLHSKDPHKLTESLKSCSRWLQGGILEQVLLFSIARSHHKRLVISKTTFQLLKGHTYDLIVEHAQPDEQSEHRKRTNLPSRPSIGRCDQNGDIP